MSNKFFQAYFSSFSNIQRNIWILSIAMFINRSGSLVLLFASLYLTKDLQFSFGTAGLIMSFYGIGSVLGSFAGGWLTDRRDHFTIMVSSLVLSGAILFLLIPAKNPVLIGTIIFLYAFVSDIFRPANSKAITLYSTPENRTRSVSLVRLAINLGFSVGPAAGGFLALHFGYHLLFVLDACTSFGAALLLIKYLPRQSKEEKTSIKAQVRQKESSAYRDLPYMVFIGLIALYGTCFFQLFASVPQYFSKVCLYNEDKIGLLLGLNGLLVVLIEMPLVAALEGKKKTFSFIIRGAICLPIAFFILLFGKGLIFWSLLYTLIITLSEIMAMPFMMNIALSRPTKERRGEYSALYAISYGISNIVAPILGLYIADHYGFNTMFVVLILISILVTLGFWGIKKRMEMPVQIPN
jgi:predicted MFS family arabinose efflux permease